MAAELIDVRIQQADFSLAEAAEQLAALRPAPGAIATFTGLVREVDGDAAVRGLLLEHYPGMTEASVEAVVAEACDRWPLRGVVLVHRVGEILAGEQIVLVATASDHRVAAYEANEFLMDYLKTRVVLWKKELRSDSGDRWIESTAADRAAAEGWSESAGS